MKKFLEAGVQCKSEIDRDFRAFVYYTDTNIYPYHTQQDVQEVRGYGTSPVEAFTDAMLRYEELT